MKFFTSEPELCAQLWHSSASQSDTTKEGLSPTGVIWEVLHQHEACCFTRRCLHITLQGVHMFMEQSCFSNRNKYLIKWHKNQPVLAFYFSFPRSWSCGWTPVTESTNYLSHSMTVTAETPVSFPLQVWEQTGTRRVREQNRENSLCKLK